MHYENLLTLKDEGKYVLSEEAEELFEDYEVTLILNSLCDDSEEVVSIRFSVSSSTHCYRFMLAQLPCNCGAMVLGYYYTNRLLSTIGADLQVLRERFLLHIIIPLIKLMGYTQIIVTLNSKYDVRVYENCGFINQKKLEFVNSRTRNVIHFLTKTLPEDIDED